MRITRVHRPSPGRKNLRVGVVRSGSHHSADSTHRLALHARPFCATPLRCSTPPKRQTSTASNPDAHALCYTPTGHALLSAARRFVRSTQNIRSDSRGQSPNALAAHFQSAALQAACQITSIQQCLLLRARGARPLQGHGGRAPRHEKNNAFPYILEGFGRKPMNYQRPGAPPVGAPSPPG